MSETNEEKSLPASDRKLREARKKGQVSKSQDLVTGAVIFASTVYLASDVAGQRVKLEALVDLVARRVHQDPFWDLWPRIIELALVIMTAIAIPLLLVTASAIVVTNIVVMRGFVFSIEPVTPKPERINPISGAKRIFSMRGFIEFLKALVKVLALGSAFIVVFRAGLQGLMQSSACGPSCIAATFKELLQPLVVTAVLAFVFVGLADVLLQNWLFQRDMKMTKSERKRERQDTEGNPEILRRRHKQRREMQSHATRTGLMNASLVVGAADGWAVGIRYVRGETPVPMVVCRATPDQARTMMTQALLADIPVVADEGLSAAIARAAQTGDAVPENTFQRVADLLVAAKLI